MARQSVLPSAMDSASASRVACFFGAQYLACTLPCRRFAPVLADSHARLGADVDRYSFIAVDLHHLLLAGLPAHIHEHRPGLWIPGSPRNSGVPEFRQCIIWRKS